MNIIRSLVRFRGRNKISRTNKMMVMETTMVKVRVKTENMENTENMVINKTRQTTQISRQPTTLIRLQQIIHSRLQ